MSLMNLFAGPSPEKLEARGDALFADGHWGPAKQAYERALHKLEKKEHADTPRSRRLRDKIAQSREHLARDHQQTALNYHEGGFDAEAREALALALEVSRDDALREELAAQLASLEEASDAGPETPAIAPVGETLMDDSIAPPDHQASREELFRALCHTLPEEVRKAYQQYGQDFIDGYIALNNGDFDSAIRHLERAMVAHPQPDSYIPLELATAYVNRNRLEEARELLEQVRLYHPEALPVYQLLCDIYWEQGETVQAEALLASLPDHLAQSMAVMQLKGETLFRAGQFEAARDFYRHFLDTFGWHDTMAQALAKVYEALDEPDAARGLYREIMGRCQGCRTRVDPAIKHQYAELAYAAGERGADLLELYFSLVREIPANAAIYFERISRIYHAQGNPVE
ncbi:MAG: tetratricopeptide repeat protein, partial [Desulfobacterales bacterium]